MGPLPAPPQAAAANGSGGTYVLHSRTQLVLIPALVTDRAGHPFLASRPSDFIVKDNGKVRHVTMAEEITSPPCFGTGAREAAARHLFE